MSLGRTGEHGRDWAERDRRRVWHSMGGYDPEAAPMVVEKGDGAWITDVEGRRYLDGMSGLWCVNVGYGREELARAAYDQLVEMPFYPLTKSHIPAIELGERLNEWLDGDYVLFYSNSGSEANEMAFKVARQYHRQHAEPDRWKFVSRYRAYHGQGLGTLAATGQAQRKYRYEPLAPGFVHVEPPDTYRRPDGMDAETYGHQCAEQLRRVIQWELPETVAGVIMEPVITGGGVIMPPDNYLPEVREICDRNGVLLIVDEVICGFGRTGRNFGHQHYGVVPDIVTMAKGITSAYLPLSVTAVRREIYEGFPADRPYERFRHMNTFGGHPAACAVALRNLEIMEREELPRRAAVLGDQLRGRLSRLEGHPNVGHVRGTGLLLGLEMVEDKESRAPSQESADALVAGCKERGLIVAKNGDTVAGLDNVVTLSPPLSMTDTDADFVAATIEKTVAEL